MKCQVSRSLISSASIGYRGRIALATSALGDERTSEGARHRNKNSPTLGRARSKGSRYHATANDPPYEDQRPRR